MDLYLAIILPSLLLLVVALGYLATVFEPYWAVNTEEGRELLRYHSGDPKLRHIVTYWTVQLLDLPEGRFNNSKEARSLFNQLHYLLVHHRFIFGDDPRLMRFGGGHQHRLLRRALALTNLNPVSRVETIGLVIKPDSVTSLTGEVIWAGQPQEYKSRFNDMYYEP